MTGELPERKLRHLDVCLTRDVKFQTVTTGLESVPWPYRALPDVNLHDIDLGASYAYSDSLSDLPMLRAVGNPVAVNPDPPLAAIRR